MNILDVSQWVGRLVYSKYIILKTRCKNTSQAAYDMQQDNC